uniref:WD repeat domain 90 n=1 Tax=Xiphophorus couchianus TaxID=32473 RepID=A0A3B5L079_9TELE
GWQHPYVNIFKHVKVEEWKRSAKAGDVSSSMDRTLRCPVFSIKGPVPTNSYILVPKSSNQSLGLTGRYFYLLFRPTPGKYFMVHLDVAVEEGQVVRISFSNMFKEFKSTATWLQFPFLCGAQPRTPACLVGPAPDSVRWTCLMMDLCFTLTFYLNRHHAHLKSVKLCANMAVKNMFTSDLLLDPGESQTTKGTGPIPREMSFPVPKGGSWNDFYDHIKFPSDGTKLPFDSIQKPDPALLPDPILRLSRIIGFGGATTRDALWTKSGEEVVYPCHAIIVSMKILSRKQRFFTGHTDKVFYFSQAPNQMVSCGRENVRLWRVRNGSLRSCPVYLGEFHSLDFTDVAFQEGGASDQFASTRSGHILEINYSRVTVKNARRLMPAQQQHAERREKWTFNTGPGIPINSISVSSSFCATGTVDGFLRLWTLDFSAVILEAEHEGPVTVVSVSFDSLQVLSATFTGNLGYLDVSSRGYNTLMRSHTGDVLGFSVDGIRRHLTTASADGTVRVWNTDSLQQLYDFVSMDKPCSVAFHPHEPTFSCGFGSGTVRVFDISSARLLAEHKYAAFPRLLTAAGSDRRRHGNVVARGTERAPDALAVSGDSSRLAFVGPTPHIVTVADARSLDELLHVDVSVLDVESPELDSALKVRFSPASAEHLLVATSANKILWISTKTGRLLRQVSNVHKRPCSSLAVSEDRRFLLTSGHNTVKVWDYKRTNQVNPQVMYIGHSQPIRQVSFTPDQLGVVSVGDAIFLWDFLAEPNECLIGNGKVNAAQLSNGMPRQAAPLPSSQHQLDVSAMDPEIQGGMLVLIIRLVKTVPRPQDECIKLKAVIGYNGNGRGNMGWSPDQGLFAYSCGGVVVLEHLHTGTQSHLQGHSEEISCLAISNDAQTLVSAAGSSRSLVSVWDVRTAACRGTASHHKGAVQSLAFSRDDLFFLSVGDFFDPVLALWSSESVQLLCSVSMSAPIHDAAFSPAAARQLACVGSEGIHFCLIHTRAANTDIKACRVSAPSEVGDVELTALCYHMDSFLLTSTTGGHVCAWDVNKQRCFMVWRADEGEIGVLLCRENRLLTGSATGRLQLCVTLGGSKVVVEQEVVLDGKLVSAAFDNSMEMGIVGTTAGTLWYINWSDSSIIRLVSGHRAKVNDVVFSRDESRFATCSQDGSVRVWSTGSFELVVQFQVINQACHCLCWSPSSSSDGSRLAAGYGDGTLRIFQLASTEMEMKLRPHQEAISAITYSASGEKTLPGSKGLVAVSSPISGATIRVIRDHKGAAINSIQSVSEQCKRFGLEGNEMFLVAGADRRVSVWAANWSKEKCDLLDWLSFPAPPSSEVRLLLPPSLAAFYPADPSLLLYTGYGLKKELSFYSLTKKQIIKKISLTHWATCISLSPRGHLLAVGCKERVLKLIKSTSGRFQDFLLHSDALQTCRFSPSGSLLFSVAYDEVLLWEVPGL